MQTVLTRPGHPLSLSIPPHVHLRAHHLPRLCTAETCTQSHWGKRSHHTAPALPSGGEAGVEGRGRPPPGLRHGSAELSFPLARPPANTDWGPTVAWGQNENHSGGPGRKRRPKLCARTTWNANLWATGWTTSVASTPLSDTHSRVWTPSQEHPTRSAARTAALGIWALPTEPSSHPHQVIFHPVTTLPQTKLVARTDTKSNKGPDKTTECGC